MTEAGTFSAEDRALIREYLKGEKRAEPTDFEVEFFTRQCERTKLDPFDRQIYAQFRRSHGVLRMSVQGTIDGFRVVAERSGKYLGQDGPFWCGPDGNWVDVWLDDSHPPNAAKVGVMKSGAPRPTYSVAKFSEYAQRGQSGQLSGLWPSMPSNQLAKCAEALALRKAFPNELSGIYTTEEMGQADNPPVEETMVTANGRPQTPEPTVTPTPTPTPEPQRKPESLATEAELDALRELIRVTETADPYVRMMLIDFGIEDVGTVEEMLPKLTVAQALHVMTKINERMAA
jgi:phage recombination protein Bet